MNKDFVCPVCRCAPLITDYCPSCSRIEGAAPLPEEVREIISDMLAVIETINQGHHAADHYDAITISCAADMIERLAADVAKWQALADGLAKLIEVTTRRIEREDRLARSCSFLIDKFDARVPEGCVVVRREISEEAKCILATPGNYRTYKDQWAALIAAGEVK